jgi:hypothetical protein
VVVVHAVDDPVQPRAEPLLGLEVEDHAVDPVLRQRPEEVAAHEQADHRKGGDALRGEHDQDHDRRHEDEHRHGRVDARQLVEQFVLEHPRRGAEQVGSAAGFHAANTKSRGGERLVAVHAPVHRRAVLRSAA